MITVPPELHLSAIAAIGPNREMGAGGRLPWIPQAADMAHFKGTTKGHIVVMGRKTHEDIFLTLGRPLPSRDSIRLSRTLPVGSIDLPMGFRQITMSSFPETLEDWPFDPKRPVFIIGGREIYDMFLPHCRELILTHVRPDKINKEVDTYFPEFQHAFATFPEEGWEIDDGLMVRRWFAVPPESGQTVS